MKSRIDVSNLSQEKRAFLKANPALLKSLEQEIPKQVSGVQKREEKLRKGKAKWQRDLEYAEKLRREYDPLLRDIQDKMLRKLDIVKGDNSLVCAECGEGDKGNKMNGKPWCFKCNVPLVTKGNVAKWMKLPKMKVLRSSLKDDVGRLVEGDE